MSGVATREKEIVSYRSKLSYRTFPCWTHCIPYPILGFSWYHYPLLPLIVVTFNTRAHRRRFIQFWIQGQSGPRCVIGGMLRSALGSSASTVASLSRAFAREIENLPTRYLRSVASLGDRECRSHPILPAGNSTRSRSRMTSRLYRTQSLLASKRGTSESRGCALTAICPRCYH